MATNELNRVRPSRKQENISKVIEEKRKVLRQLAEEYEKVYEKYTVDFVPEAAIKIQNAEYLKLKAELAVTKELESQIIPNDADFLFEWAKSNVERDIEKLKNTISEQDKCIEELSKNKKHDDTPDESTFTLLQGLHKKLSNRLRKLLCSVENNVTSESGIDMDHPNSLYNILKELLPELENPSNLDLFGDSELEFKNEADDTSNLELLLKNKIIKKKSKNPHIFVLNQDCV